MPRNDRASPSASSVANEGVNPRGPRPDESLERDEPRLAVGRARGDERASSMADEGGDGRAPRGDGAQSGAVRQRGSAHDRRAASAGKAPAAAPLRAHASNPAVSARGAEGWLRKRWARERRPRVSRSARHAFLDVASAGGDCHFVSAAVAPRSHC